MGEERIDDSGDCVGEERLWLFFEEKLDEEESKKTQEHLSGCAACAERWGEISALGKLLRRGRPLRSEEVRLAQNAVRLHFRRRNMARAVTGLALAAGFILTVVILKGVAGPEPRAPRPKLIAERNGELPAQSREARSPAGRSGGSPEKKAGKGESSAGSEGDRFKLKCGASCDLAEGSVGEALLDSERACVFRLESGRARFEVPPGTNFSVETPDARVEVLGTIFVVDFSSESGTTEVSVERGEVGLFSLRGELLCRIPAGMRASTASLPGKTALPPGLEEPTPLDSSAPPGTPRRTTDLPEKR